MRNRIGIHIVDDHALFREGLKFLLESVNPEYEVFESINGESFLKSLDSIYPDIVLMDIDMPVLNGIETTKKAKEKYPELKVIALTMHTDESFYTEMIEVGAKGFLIKNTRFEEVMNAIDEVYQGGTYFPPEILARIIKNLKHKKTNYKSSELSKREIEILDYICKGYSNTEISDYLFISKRTVDKHRENILLKSCSKNTAELVVYAIRKGYFEV